MGAFKKFDLNIKSIAVSKTDFLETSRLTIIAEGHNKQIKRVTAQVKKLRDVLEIDDMSRQEFLDRELALIKVHFRHEEFNQLAQTAEIFAHQVIAMGKQTITFEITGDEKRVDGFINALNFFGIRALARSGRVAHKMGR